MTQSLHPPTCHDRCCTPPHCTLGKERRGVGRRGRTPPHGQSLTHPSPVHYPCSQGPPSPPYANLALGCPTPRLESLEVKQRCPTQCPTLHPYPTISSPCPILTPLTLGPQDGSPNPPNEGPPSTAGDSTGCPGSPAPLWAQPPAPQALLFVVLGPRASPALITCPRAGSGIWSAVLCRPVTAPRSLSVEPSQTPDRRHLPHHPQRPQDGSLHLSCLDTQLCLLPIKLALGRSEVALSQDQAQGWGPEGQWGRGALTCC